MSTLQLTVHEAELAGGAHGEAAQLAMRIVARFGEVTGASRLVEISGAHIDACMFHGQVSLDFVDRLLELGAKVAVPTTLNVGTIDLLHPELSRADEQHREWGRRVMYGYAALGAPRTWTCAPYQEAQRPGLGEHVAWAESNAMCSPTRRSARARPLRRFLRRLRSDHRAGAVCGSAHRGEPAGHGVLRRLRPARSAAASELAYPLLGFVISHHAGNEIPVLDGVPAGQSEDRIKAHRATLAEATHASVEARGARATIALA